MSSRQSADGARRDVTGAEDSYGESAGTMMDLSGFELATFDSETAAEGFERSRPAPMERPAAVPADRLPADRPPAAEEGDDLPDALVGTEDDFLNALDLPRGKAAPPKRRPRPAPAPPKPDRPGSVGAAADLLEAVGRQQDSEEDYGFDDETLADGPLPPRRRRKTRSPEPAAAPARGVNLNHLVLLTALAIPALGFAMHAAFGTHQSTQTEWREAFDDLDELMNEFVDVSRAPEPQWVAWKTKFETARSDLRFKVESAPDDSAGGRIDRAINTLEQAVALRSDGAPPALMDKTVRRAVGHAQEAAVRLGYNKREWAM